MGSTILISLLTLKLLRRLPLKSHSFRKRERKDGTNESLCGEGAEALWGNFLLGTEQK